MNKMAAAIFVCLFGFCLSFDNIYRSAASIFAMLALFFMVEMICDAIRSLKVEK